MSEDLFDDPRSVRKLREELKDKGRTGYNSHLLLEQQSHDVQRFYDQTQGIEEVLPVTEEMIIDKKTEFYKTVKDILKKNKARFEEKYLMEMVDAMFKYPDLDFEPLYVTHGSTFRIYKDGRKDSIIFNVENGLKLINKGYKP